MPVLLPVPQLLLEEFGKEQNLTLNATMVQRNLYFAAIFNATSALINAPDSTLKVGVVLPSITTNMYCSWHFPVLHTLT